MTYFSCTIMQWHHSTRSITYSRWSQIPWGALISIWGARSEGVQWIMDLSAGCYRPVNTYRRRYATSNPNGRRGTLDGNGRNDPPHPSLRITSPNWTYHKNWIQRKSTITNLLLVLNVGWSKLAGSILSPNFPFSLPSLKIQGVDTLSLYSTYFHICTVSIMPGWCLILHIQRLTWEISRHATGKNFMAQLRKLCHLTHPCPLARRWICAYKLICITLGIRSPGDPALATLYYSTAP